MGLLSQFCNKDSVLFPVKDLWGGGGKAGGLFPSLVFRGRLLPSVYSWAPLGSPQNLCVLELEGPGGAMGGGGGVAGGGGEQTPGHPVSRAEFGWFQA